MSPNGQIIQRFIGFSYVDDADLTVADSERDVDTGTVQKQMQAMLDKWEESIQATGGSLAPEKLLKSDIVQGRKREMEIQNKKQNRRGSPNKKQER